MLDGINQNLLKIDYNICILDISVKFFKREVNYNFNTL